MGELLGEESAKAIKEVAGTTGKAIDAGREFGHWFAKYCGHPLEQGMGLWGDKLYYRRIDNLVAFMEKSGDKIKALGLEEKLKPLEMKIGVPLLEAASLEDDEYLRELWANLLVNSVNNSSKAKIHPSFIQVLKSLSREEAKIMAWIAEHHSYGKDVYYEITSWQVIKDEKTMEQWKMETAENAGLNSLEVSDVEAWFDNLLRLELLKEENNHESTYEDGGHNRHGSYGPSVTTEYYKSISISSFGQKFIDAISMQGVKINGTN